jgi:hypothetical protein
MRNETGAAGRVRGEIFLPARLANVGAAQAGFFVEQDGVIRLFVGKRLRAGCARAGAGLDVPFVHGQRIFTRISRIGTNEKTEFGKLNRSGQTKQRFFVLFVAVCSVPKKMGRAAALLCRNYHLGGCA